MAELQDSAGAPAGHLMVEQEVRWSQLGGFLWWRQWGEPEYALDIYLCIHGRCHELSLWRREDVDRAVEGLARGEWLDDTAARETIVYKLRWLSPDEGARTAQRVWGISIDSLRELHHHSAD